VVSADAAAPLWTSVAQTRGLDVVKAVERMRLAEDQLARRRQASCGPTPLLREVTRLIAEADHRHESITAAHLAEELDVAVAEVDKALSTLETARVVTTQRNPTGDSADLLVPLRRIDPVEGLDHTALAMLEYAERLAPQEAEVVTAFLEQLADLLARECH